MQINKYPRTHHIQGSRIQPGDENLDSVAFENISGRHLVVEEKMDGANCAVSFSPAGKLMLQSRGHYLTGGKREKHFNLFKTWAATHAGPLGEVLGSRYVMYGEWLYAKHTIYYNRLPHYFLEFDILDRDKGSFLSTPRRNALIESLGFVRSVKVLHQGILNRMQDLTNLVVPSYFITHGHIRQLHKRAAEQGIDADRALKETDNSLMMEGLYIKIEENGMVTGRFKFVRHSFLNTVLQSRTHWLNRPIISNMLADEVEMFGDRP